MEHVYSKSEYITFFASCFIVTVVINLLIKKPTTSTFLSAGVCSALNLLYQAAQANFDVNLAWGPPQFIITAIFMLPFCFLVALPFALIRWIVSVRRMSKE